MFKQHLIFSVRCLINYKSLFFSSNVGKIMSKSVFLLVGRWSSLLAEVISLRDRLGVKI